MPDRETVIKVLKHCEFHLSKACLDCPYSKYNSLCLEAIKADALSLLREQEKTKVVFKQFDGSVESECGNCGLYLDKTYSVCPKCWKELDWNG